MKTSTLFLLSAIIVQTVAFTPSLPLSSSTSSSKTILNAKKKSNQNKTSGGGFGAPSQKSKPSTQTRSVSGYTGSGTKPLAKAANTFDQIRKVYGKEGTSDLYMRSPLNDPEIFWYVGKVVRRLEQDENMEGEILPNEMEAVISQKRLIMEYAKHQLRPQNFGGPYASSLELWIAPGDSEMDVVQNKISLVKVTGSTKDLREGFSVSDVGFNPEIYVGDEQKDGGLRVKRDENGDPVKDVFEING